MPDTVLVAILSLIGTLAGSFGGHPVDQVQDRAVRKKGGKTQFCDGTHISIRRENKGGEPQDRRSGKKGRIRWKNL